MWLSNGSSRLSSSTKGRRRGESSSRIRDREGLQASVAGLLLLRLPNAFLLYGVVCFLTGFGLFLGLAWRMDLDNTPSRDDNLAVMVMYIVVGSISVLGSAGVVKWKMGEVHQAEKSVGKDIEEGEGNEDGDEDGSGSAKRSQDDDSEDGDEDEADALIDKNKKIKGGENNSPREAIDHERIAKALEDAAKAHREVARLLKDSFRKHHDDGKSIHGL